MTNKEINATIYKSLGYVLCADDDMPGQKYWHHPHGGSAPPPPDYCNDLNAMHEAEKTLDGTNGGPESPDCLCYAYAHMLYGNLVPRSQQVFRATARQRAEAFLRVIGKWRDE
jgi:hypothetical protein